MAVDISAQPTRSSRSYTTPLEVHWLRSANPLTNEYRVFATPCYPTDGSKRRHGRNAGDARLRLSATQRSSLPSADIVAMMRMKPQGGSRENSHLHLLTQQLRLRHV